MQESSKKKNEEFAPEAEMPQKEIKPGTPDAPNYECETFTAAFGMSHEEYAQKVSQPTEEAFGILNEVSRDLTAQKKLLDFIKSADEIVGISVINAMAQQLIGAAEVKMALQNLIGPVVGPIIHNRMALLQHQVGQMNHLLSQMKNQGAPNTSPGGIVTP